MTQTRLKNAAVAGDLTAARIQARRAAEMYRYQVEVEERFNYKNGLTMLLYGLASGLGQIPHALLPQLLGALANTVAVRFLHVAHRG